MRGFSILAGAALALVPLAAGANDRDPAATAQPAQTIDPVRLQAAQRTVDDAHTRYFIAHIHRLRDEAHAGSPTEELGA